jgi:hypothetical protein
MEPEGSQRVKRYTIFLKKRKQICENFIFNFDIHFIFGLGVY